MPLSPGERGSSMKKFTTVGLGELLWDIFPEGRQLGGAPANFAYMTNLLGDEGIVASRVGSDELGEEAKHRLEHLGLGTSCIQTRSHVSHGSCAGRSGCEGPADISNRRARRVGCVRMDGRVASAGTKSRRSVLRFSGATVSAFPRNHLLFFENNSAGDYARLRCQSSAVFLFRADSCRFRETCRHHQVKPR